MLLIRPYQGSPSNAQFYQGFALAFDEPLHPWLLSIVPSGLEKERHIHAQIIGEIV